MGRFPRFRNSMQTQRVTDMRFRGLPLLTKAERDQFDADREAFLNQKPPRQRNSKGHIENVVKEMKKVRRSRKKQKPPRGVKRKALETVVMMNLK